MKRTESFVCLGLCAVLIALSLVACMAPEAQTHDAEAIVGETTGGEELIDGESDEEASDITGSSEGDTEAALAQDPDTSTEAGAVGTQAAASRQTYSATAGGTTPSSSVAGAQQVFASQAAAVQSSSSSSSSSQASASLAASSSSTPVVSTPSYTVGIDDDITDQVIAILNRNRRANGLDELSRNAGLMDAAAVRAQELYTSYSHTRPDGSTWYSALHNRSDFGGIAENICMGYSTAEAIMKAFMNSSGHYKNIMGNYNSLGIGVYRGPDGKLYCAQLFGRATGLSTGSSSSSSSSSAASSSSSSPSSSSSSSQSSSSQPETDVTIEARLSEETITLRVGESRQIFVDVGSSTISGLTLDWSTSGTQATVSSNGVITAHEPGLALAMVKVVYGGQTKQILYCSIEILPVEEAVPPPDVDQNDNREEDTESATELESADIPDETDV